MNKIWVGLFTNLFEAFEELSTKPKQWTLNIEIKKYKLTRQTLIWVWWWGKGYRRFPEHKLSMLRPPRARIVPGNQIRSTQMKCSVNTSVFIWSWGFMNTLRISSLRQVFVRFRRGAVKLSMILMSVTLFNNSTDVPFQFWFSANWWWIVPDTGPHYLLTAQILMVIKAKHYSVNKTGSWNLEFVRGVMRYVNILAKQWK